MIERQEISKTLCMAVILPQRILEVVLISEQDLCPVRIGFVSEDPTTHVFRFYNEDAEAGDNNMIDLRGAVACGEDDVVDGPVNVVIQEHPHAQ